MYILCIYIESRTTPSVGSAERFVVITQRRHLRLRRRTIDIDHGGGLEVRVIGIDDPHGVAVRLRNNATRRIL